MAAKNRQTLIDRTRTGKPWVSGDLADLVDTIFAIDLATNRKIGAIESSIKNVSTTINNPATDPFADLPGFGFLTKSNDGKWGFDASSYITKEFADSWYARKEHSHSHASIKGRSAADSHPFGAISGILLANQFPTLSGDVENTEIATTVIGIGGFSIPTLGATAGFLRWSGSGWVLDAGSSGGGAHNDLSGRSDPSCHPFTALSGILESTQFPALTGDVANTALATTVNGLKGYVLPTLGAAANLRWSGSAWTMDANSYALASSLSAYAPLEALSNYVLKTGDTMTGTLYAPSVSLTGALSLPTWDIATNVSNEMVFKKSGSVKVWFKTADIVTSMNLLPNGPGQTLGGSGTEWNARLNSAWIGSSTGMLKTVAGEVQIASESDLPGGPFLHASGGVTNRVAKWTSATALGYGIITDDGDVVHAGTTPSVGRFRSNYAGTKAQLIGNAYSTHWWGIGTSGTTDALVRIGTTDGDGAFNSSPFEFSVLGSLSYNGGTFRDYAGASPTSYSMWYSNSLTPDGQNYSFGMRKDGTNTYVNSLSRVNLNVNDVVIAAITSSGMSIPSLSSGGMVKAVSGTGLLGIAGRSDLPGGPYLPLSAGSGERVTGGLYLDNDFFLDGRAFLGNGDFIVRTGEVIFKIGDGFGWASPSIHFPSVATQYSFRVEGGSRFDGTADFTNPTAGIRTTDIKVGSALQKAPHLYSTSNVLPELGVNEWCFLVCDQPSGMGVFWLTNGTQHVRVRSGGTTTTTNPGGNQVQDSGGAIPVSRTTCILIGPTDSGTIICSLIPF